VSGDPSAQPTGGSPIVVALDFDRRRFLEAYWVGTGRSMDGKLLHVRRSIWLAFIGTSLLFVLFPQIDLSFSSLFYTPGLGFEVSGAWYERVIYYGSELLIAVISLALVALWAYTRLAKRRFPIGLSGRELGFVLLVLALGPGLVVNWGLKDHWGRARPMQVAEFGGARTFTPAWVISDQGGGSFSSGHAAATFYLVAVTLVMARRRRRLWIALALAWSLVVGLTRIASGSHFLSDVVVSFFIVLILMLMLRGLMFGPSSPGRRAPAR
jgi:lipid A 4'-phosphatase